MSRFERVAREWPAFLKTNRPLAIRGARRRVPVAESIARLRAIGARGAGGGR